MKRRDFVKLLGAGGTALTLPASLAGASGIGTGRPAPMQTTLQATSGGVGMDRQIQIYMAGRLGGQKPDYPVSVDDLEKKAAETMKPEAYGYVAGGAGAERTMQYNRNAFTRYRILPRMLRDVASRDLSVNLFGQKLPYPILLAPIGVQSIIHPEAEEATAKAAASLGVPMVCSTVSSKPMELIGGIKKDAPNWFQLYWPKSTELAVSLVERAEKAGFGAIVITLDTYLLAWRERDIQQAYLPFLYGDGLANYFTDPVFQSMLGSDPAENPMDAIQLFAGIGTNASVTWDDLKILKETTTLPIVLKGILHPEDARLAMQYGMDGIIVSNHGGRQVDGSVASLDMLPEVVKVVDGAIPVLFDSGIRRGADAFIALALGADAVLIGRPYAYGLATNGEQGVRDVLHNFIADFDLTMGLAGVKKSTEIQRDYLAG